MFEKFLGGGPKEPEPPKLHSGQKGYRKPRHLCKRPPRYDERHDPETGWLKRSERQRKASGYRHYKVRRKRWREGSRKLRKETDYRYVRSYNKTLNRKFIQNRSWNKRLAKKKGLDPDLFYQLTLADWLLVWESSEDVWRDGKFHRPKELQDNPVKRNGDCCWFDRIDKEKPFTLDNVCVRYRGKQLNRTVQAG